jgi:hypothetical protein
MNKFGYNVAKQYMFSQTTCDSLSAVREMYTPVAEGTINEGFIVPDKSPFLDNEQCQSFISGLLLHNLNGLNNWIHLIHLLKKNHHHPFFISTYKSLLKLVKPILGVVNFATWTIPYPQMRNTPNYGSMCYIADASMMDIMNDLNIIYVADFLNVVVQISLFGFPLHSKVIKALQIEETVTDYIYSRLVHGKVDIMLKGDMERMNIKTEGSAFLPEIQSDSVELDQALQKLYDDKSDPKRMKMRLNDIKTKVNKQHFLGNNSELIQTLAERNMIKSGDAGYDTYLKKPIPQKLGMKGYKKIMREGRTRMLKLPTEPQSKTPVEHPGHHSFGWGKQNTGIYN